MARVVADRKDFEGSARNIACEKLESWDAEKYAKYEMKEQDLRLFPNFGYNTFLIWIHSNPTSKQMKIERGLNLNELNFII